MKEELPEDVLTDLINMIDQEIGEPSLPRPKGFGITVTEYMELKGCSKQIARKMLDRMVECGKFAKKYMVDGRGTTPQVYYPIKQSSPSANPAKNAGQAGEERQ